MDRNLLENLSNLTGLPMAQLLEKLGRIDVVDNPFEKADPERVRPAGSVRGNGPQPQVGNGLSAGAANGGPLPSTTPIRSNTMTGNGSGAGGQNAVNMQVGNGLSAGAANGGPLPSTTANPAGAAAASPRGGGGTQAYQLGGVKEGFWGGVNQLASANNISNPNQLSVGQQLKMPDGSSYTVRGGDTLSGIYQSRSAAAQAAPAAPAAAQAQAPVGADARGPLGPSGEPVVQNLNPAPAAAPARAAAAAPGTTGPSGEQIQPNLNRAPAAAPAPLDDPMTNGERRQGNQFLASSPYEETASPPPEIAASRPGEKTDGLSSDTNPYPLGQNTPYSPTSTDEPTNPREFRTSTGNRARQAAASQAFAQESQRMAPPDLTRSLKKKGAWFSSATHPIIRGY